MKADVNAQGENSRTPLHEAVSGKHKSRLAVVQALLAAGAEVDRLDGNSDTPFQTAASMGASIEVVEALLAAGAFPKLVDSLGRDVLAKAESNGHRHLMEILTKHCRGG